MSSVADKLARKSSKSPATKQVRLKLVYVDFWSAVKLSFLIMVALGIVLIVGAFLVWMVLAQTQIFDTLSGLYGEISGDTSFKITDVFGLGQVLGIALVIAILNIIVGTVLGAIGTVLYNLSVRITGGVLVGFTNQ
ncbi:DUF3566 domain-containing protein [Amnibacterium flavum]|uniref:DUF3566 domain-containing protein n=1 Tax=Amnibacterium flavum TaxID=2173173 RepID=A0A2V1HT27_9MICO|nr:DUF3566 domain-containing protein [Amnibacterium flavum]PVZ95491.1 hypothetical protein DDQ50_02990 [Amnibacterium flavum]